MTLTSEVKSVKNIAGPILVTAAIIKMGDKLMITKRGNSSKYAGYWEFPGGKVEYGESPRECLIREIKEELGCEISIESLYADTSIVYPDGRHLIILFYNCQIIAGNPKITEHQELKWVKKTELDIETFLEADKEVADKIRNS